MAFIFVPLLAGTAIIGFAVWIYFSRCVVLVVEETAAGNEEVVWPDEPMMDWIWMGGYMAWLVGVWLVPAVVFARIVTRGMDVDAKSWVYVGSLLGVFWLTFPVSLLSTMSAESRWAVFHPGLFRRLAANPGQVALFYLVSGVLIGACVPLTVLLGTGGDPLSLIAGALVLGASVMLIARMLGRLAHTARLTEIRPRKRKRPKPESNVEVSVTDPWEMPEEVESEEEAVRGGFVQPSDLPAISTPFEGDITGYDVNFEAKPEEPKPPPRKPRKKRRDPDDDDAPVPVRRDYHADRVIREEHEAARRRATEVVPDKVEMDRLRRKTEKPKQTNPLSKIGYFLLQSQVSVNLAVLALGFGMLGLCARGLRLFMPPL